MIIVVAVEAAKEVVTSEGSSCAVAALVEAIMHQSFVTTSPHEPTGKSGDNDFSSIKALLEAQHCGDLLIVIALFFIKVNSTGVYLRNITSPALTRHCMATQKVSTSHISPAMPHPSPRCWWWWCVWGGGRGRGSGFK